MVGRYSLGEIPPLSVFKGDTLTISLESKLGAGAAYSLTVEGTAPKGAIALDSFKGVLSFTPAPQDRKLVRVTVQAKKDGKIEQQTVDITPVLPSDFNLIQHRSSDRTAPKPEGWQYITFVEEPAQAKKEIFNNEVEHSDEDQQKLAIQTRHVTVSGVRLVLEQGDKRDSLFARLSGSKAGNGRKDLKRVTLCADEIVVRSRLELPGTELTIFARKLIFEKEGQIITTPRFVSLEATQRMQAHKGQDAGNIHLYVQQLEMPGDTVRLVTAGGQGQAAKPGLPGENGNNMTAWHGHSETPNQLGLGGTVGLDWPKEHEGHKPVYVEVGYYFRRTARSGQKTAAWERFETFGEKRWPGDSKDPKAKPGAPGQGGNGGSILSPFASQLEKKTDRRGGSAGKKAENIAAAKAGEPRQACWARAVYERTGFLESKVVGYEISDKHTSNTGAKADAPDAFPKDAPKPGELKALDRTGAGYWLHPASVRALLAYANDSMLAGRPDDAREKLTVYEATIASALKAGGALSDASASSVEWPALHADIAALFRRMDSPNDYFGNPPGWVPMLSFEANLSLYKTQIGEAINTMYLAYWIGQNQQKSQKVKATLDTALATLAEETKQAESDSIKALAVLGKLEKQSTTISEQITDLDAKRKIKMSELEKEAANQLRWEKLLRASGEALGALIQLVPVGQPALGAVGKGLTALSALDPDNPGKTISGVAAAFSDLAKEKLTAKLTPLFASIKEAKTELEEEEKNDKKEEDAEKAQEKAAVKKGLAKKKVAEKVSKILEEEKAAKEQLLGAFSKFTASEDEVKERLQRLEADCPEFQKLIKEIAKLNTSKAAVIAELTATLEILDEAATVLLTNQQAEIELRSQLDTTLDQLNHAALEFIRGMGQRARQRLLKYQYYLLKSYHYLMLEDFPEIDFGAQKVFDEFARILGAEATLSETQYKALRAIFDAELQDIIEKIIGGYQNRGFGRENDFVVPLTEGQLQILNETKELTLDPMQMARLDLERDKIRLMSIGIEEVSLSGLPNNSASLSLAYAHDGTSHLRSGRRLYVFHSGLSSPTADRQQMFWETVINIKHDSKAAADKALSWTWKESPVDQEADSLLGHLINRVAGDDTKKRKTAESLLSYRPSPWAKITIRPQEAHFNYKIDKLVLKFSYVANLVADDLATVLVRMTRGRERLIYCDSYDLNQRGDGIGTFLRTFPRGTKITLEAPGEDFEGWQIGKQQSKPKGPLQLTLDNRAYIIKANFRAVAGAPALEAEDAV